MCKGDKASVSARGNRREWWVRGCKEILEGTQKVVGAVGGRNSESTRKQRTCGEADRVQAPHGGMGSIHVAL